MDLVWVVRRGDDNEELRYSIRSAVKNLPHDRVWIIGYKPVWLDGLAYLPTHQSSTKWRNSTMNVKKACIEPAISDPFVLLNDDFFVMRPVDEVPVLHRGPVDDVIADYEARYNGGRGAYTEGMRQTRDLLHRTGYPHPLSYELHVPIIVHKAAMLSALSIGDGMPVLHKRTAYGNLAGLGGEQTVDCKVTVHNSEWSPDWLYLSTDDASFDQMDVGAHVRACFPDPSPYEVV